jgi:hypothetical protein
VKNVPTKQDLKLDITELELAAELVEKEEEEKQKMQELHSTLSGLHLSDEDSRYEYSYVTVDLNIASVLYNDILVKCQLFQCP